MSQQVSSGLDVDASGWVLGPTTEVDAITLGSCEGKGISATLQGLWVLTDVAAFNSLDSANSSVYDVLTANTVPQTAAPTVELEVLTPTVTVAAQVTVGVRASAAAGRTVRARVTFWGATPRCGGLEQSMNTAKAHSTMQSSSANMLLTASAVQAQCMKAIAFCKRLCKCSSGRHMLGSGAATVVPQPSKLVICSRTVCDQCTDSMTCQCSCIGRPMATACHLHMMLRLPHPYLAQ